jgi:hypothetical protein
MKELEEAITRLEAGKKTIYGGVMFAPALTSFRVGVNIEDRAAKPEEKMYFEIPKEEVILFLLRNEEGLLGAVEAAAWEYFDQRGLVVCDSMEFLEAGNRFLGAFTVVTRCSGRNGSHGATTYGPVYTSMDAAWRAGRRYQVECSCGRREHPLSPPDEKEAE